MPCPICGANCQCKNRGPYGLCCDCHRHKVSAATLGAWLEKPTTTDDAVWRSYEKHKEWLLDAENVKTVGEAMAKKDARNKLKESGSWRPHKWTTRRRRVYLEHMLGAAYAELSWWVGEYQAGLLMAELRRDVMQEMSREMLKAKLRSLEGLP